MLTRFRVRVQRLLFGLGDLNQSTKLQFCSYNITDFRVIISLDLTNIQLETVTNNTILLSLQYERNMCRARGFTTYFEAPPSPKTRLYVTVPNSQLSASVA